MLVFLLYEDDNFYLYTQETSLCCRQPFIIAYAIAAVAWDLAAPLANSNAGAPAVRVFIDTHHRNEALRMVDEEIVQLLQLISPFSLATTFQDVLMRYVFLRRALQGRVNIDEVRLVNRIATCGQLSKSCVSHHCALQPRDSQLHIPIWGPIHVRIRGLCILYRLPRYFVSTLGTANEATCRAESIPYSAVMHS